MYAIFGVINVRPEDIPAFREATIHEAQDTVDNEPGFFQFHILIGAGGLSRF